MTINENAAYLKGLAEGYGITASKEGEIISKLLELVADMTDKINALEADNQELREYIEEIDEDLGAVEEDLYFTDEDEDEDDEFFDDEEDFDDDGFYQMECPACGEEICFDDSLDADELVCPACGAKVSDIEICDGNCDDCDDDECKEQQ